MPDALHWLGVNRIDRFVSMSNMKHEPLVRQGIEIVERIPIPAELVPDDAQVEIEAKKAAGYFTEEPVPEEADLAETKGRGLTDY
jgi:GTP cyclohydrolase II